MKLVILAGGLGTRLSEETKIKPKPMVEIGGKPILWHIMKYYSCFGINEFIICCGYKGNLIKEYFLKYKNINSDIRINLKDNHVDIISNDAEEWSITCIDTGENTMTGGRIKRIKDYIDNDTFLMTYGDGLSNVDIKGLINFHKTHNKLVTLTAVNPPVRFGNIEMNEAGSVSSFMEKPPALNSWINGGFFVLNKEIFNFIDSDSTSWEEEPLRKITSKNELMAFKHKGFWQPMDSLREKELLEDLYLNDDAPWKIW